MLAALVLAACLAQDLSTVEREAAERVKAEPSGANWQKLGLSRYLQNKYTPAIEAFEETLRRDPQLWTAHLFLGISRYRTNQFPPALAALDRADQLAPLDAQGRDDVDYWLSATRIALRQPLRGLHSLERLLARKPGHPAALQLATETYAEIASGLWNRVAERAFASPAGQEVHGYALESEGNRAGALEAFRRSRELMPKRPGPGAALGRLLLISGDTEVARDALAKELQNDPASPEAHLYTGLLALGENQPARAAESLKLAAVWMPQNEEPLLALCQAYLALGDAARAVTVARQAVSVQSGSVAAHELLLAAFAAAGDRPGGEAEHQRWDQRKRRP